MDNRKYNIYFHTHTVSGIIICAVLYVMFFAGSFSFFKDDFSAWQKNSSYIKSRQAMQPDYTAVLDSLSRHHNLQGRDFEFQMQRNEVGAYVTMSASKDTTVSNEAAKGEELAGSAPLFFTYHFGQKKAADYADSYDMGEFLYRLHFLAQLNAVPIRLGVPFGYLLAGIVSFLFLFALITGLMLHWNKIASHFFTFRPWSKWKTVWTDLHTALGVLQFPFQFVFAVTGVVLIMNSFLLIPYKSYVYQGNEAAMYHDLEYSDSTNYTYAYQPLQTTFDLSKYMRSVENEWKNSRVSLVQVKNYHDANMHVVVQGKPHADASFSGTGKMLLRVRDNKVLHDTAPTAPSTYVDKVKSTIYHLHFGDFGGRPLRVIFFVLGLLGCVVIISGILIWLVARDKKNVPQKKRKFNFWTANIFMAVCLSMLPVTAFTMIGLLFMEQPVQSDIYSLYFYSWLVLSLYFVFRRSLAITNHQTLLLSVVLCLLVPVSNGFVRGNWLWQTYRQGAYDILFIDILFLSLSLLSAIVLLKLKKRKPEKQIHRDVHPITSRALVK